MASIKYSFSDAVRPSAMLIVRDWLIAIRFGCLALKYFWRCGFNPSWPYGSMVS